MSFLKAFLFILLLYHSILFAQQEKCNFVISGKVIDDHDQQPLELASVYIRELQKGTITDSTGNYSITGLCKGTYTLICSHIGCESIKEIIEIKGNIKKDFYPEHHTELLQTITVKGKKIKADNISPLQKISGKELQLTRGETLGESLKSISGVTTLTTGGSISKPVIHGLHSNRILILNNGVRQEGQQWGSEHAPEIDPFIANNLTVIKGANAVRYGPDAIGGVILVEPNPLPDTIGTSGDITLAGFSNGRQGIASAMLNGKFRKLSSISWRIQGTSKRGGNLNTPDYFLKNTAVEEYNFSWNINYKKRNYDIELFYSQFNTNIGIFSASHIGNLTDLQKAFEAPTPLETADFTYKIDRPWQHIEHELFKIKSVVKTGEKSNLNIIYARQYNLRFEYDKHLPLNDSLAGLNLPQLHLELTTHTGDIIWKHRLSEYINGSIGLSSITQKNTYEGRLFIPNYQNFGTGLFWIEQWHKKKLSIEAGLRYDYRWMKVYTWQNNVIISPEYEFENLAGTFDAQYRLNDHLSFYINSGTAWRPPTVSELYSNGVHHGAASVEIGNTGLSAEKSYNSAFSIVYDLSEKLNLETGIYYNYIHNYIYLKPILPPTLTIRGAFPTFHYEQTDASFKGLDITFRYYLTKNVLFVSKNSIIRARNISTDDFLIFIPSDRFENGVKYNLPDIKKLKQNKIECSILYVNKQWRVPANSDYVSPPAAYTLFNLTLSSDWHIKDQIVSFSIVVHNLLNISYRDYMNRFRYYSDELGRNISLKINIPLTFKNKNYE